jgi:hypothetical protein
VREKVRRARERRCGAAGMDYYRPIFAPAPGRPTKIVAR